MPRLGDRRTPRERWETQQHDRPLGMYQEQLARNSPAFQSLPQRRPDARHNKWLAERRLEQEHVMALADRYEKLNEQFDSLSGTHNRLHDAIYHSERYVRDLESQLSNYMTRYGSFDNGSTSDRTSNNSGNHHGGVDPTTRPIQASEENLRRGESPEARRRNRAGTSERYSSRTGMADSGGGQSNVSAVPESDDQEHTTNQQVDQVSNKDQGPERRQTSQHGE